MVQFCQSAKIAKSVLYNPFYSPSHIRIYIYILYIRYQISYIYIERYIYSDQKVLRIVFGKHTKHHKSGTHTQIRTPVYMYIYMTVYVYIKVDTLQALQGALSCTGASYGTAVAATYGNMFHQRVGKMVINGSLALTAWRVN